MKKSRKEKGRTMKRGALIFSAFLLLTSTFGRASVVIEAAETYGHPSGDPTCPLKWQRYHPSTGTQWPIVIFIHDGGFSVHGFDGPHNMTDACTEIANHGWEAIAIDVRSDDPAQYIPGQTTTGFANQQNDDAFTAVLAARAHSSWNGSKIFVVGGSGGASLTCETCGSPTLGVNRADGCVMMSGDTDFSDRTPYTYLAAFAAINRAYCNVADDSPGNLAIMLADSPVSRIDSSMTPTMIVRAPNEFMPPAQALRLIEKLDALGVTNYVSVLEGTNEHAWDHWPLIHTSAIAFFDALLADVPPPPPMGVAFITISKK
jgi:dienelactone hydrolase